MIYYSFESVEQTKREMKNQPEKEYLPIFKSEEEINLLKQKATLPEDRPKDPVPFVDYERVYEEVKRSKIMFEKLGHNDRQVSEHCQLRYSYDNDGALVAKANCFSLSSKQEDDGVRNSFYHVLGNSPGYFIEDKPIEKIVDEIIQQKIEENQTIQVLTNQSGTILEFTLKEKVGLSHP